MVCIPRFCLHVKYNGFVEIEVSEVADLNLKKSNLQNYAKAIAPKSGPVPAYSCTNLCHKAGATGARGCRCMYP